MKKLSEYLFPKYSQWEDFYAHYFSCKSILIQSRYRLRDNKRQFRSVVISKWMYPHEATILINKMQKQNNAD